MTTVSVNTGSRAAAVSVASFRNACHTDGNVERHEYGNTQTTQFIPPHNTASFTVNEGDTFELRELADGINSVEDLRKAPVDLDEEFAKAAEGDSGNTGEEVLG
jgi:hypothetical protein